MGSIFIIQKETPASSLRSPVKFLVHRHLRWKRRKAALYSALRGKQAFRSENHIAFNLLDNRRKQRNDNIPIPLHPHPSPWQQNYLRECTWSTSSFSSLLISFHHIYSHVPLCRVLTVYDRPTAVHLQTHFLHITQHYLPLTLHSFPGTHLR